MDLKWLLPLTMVLGTLGYAPVVRADDDEAAEITKMAKEHYKLGLDAYKAGKFDVAIKELKKAYVLKKIPALLINMAATYRKLGDNELALHFYKKFLDEAPADAPQRADVEKAVAELQEGQGQGKKTTVASTKVEKTEKAPPVEEEKHEPAAVPAAKTSDFNHSVIDAAPPGSPLDVRVSMPVMKGVKVFVYYRASGESDFKSVLMKRLGSEKIGRIPAKALTGKSIQYYIEAKDGKGGVVSNSGSVANPNVVLIDPDAKPQTVLAMAEERREERVEEPPAAEEPREEKVEKKSTKSLDEEAAPLSEEDDEKLAKEKKQRERRTRDRGPGLGPLTTAGIALAVIGAAAAVSLGSVGAIRSKSFGDAVASDSRSIPSFRFNEPDASVQDDAYFEQQGKLWHNLGISMTVVGSAMSVAGIAMALVDQLYLKKGGSTGSKKKKKRRPVEDEEARLFQITPEVAPGYAGVGAGFRF